METKNKIRVGNGRVITTEKQRFSTNEELRVQHSGQVQQATTYFDAHANWIVALIKSMGLEIEVGKKYVPDYEILMRQVERRSAAIERTAKRFAQAKRQKEFDERDAKRKREAKQRAERIAQRRKPHRASQAR